MILTTTISKHVGALINEAENPNSREWENIIDKKVYESEVGKWPSLTNGVKTTNVGLKLHGGVYLRE